MRRLIRKQDLTQTFLDIVKKNDKEVLEICYEVAQYRMNQHFEKAKEVKIIDLDNKNINNDKASDEQNHLAEDGDKK